MLMFKRITLGLGTLCLGLFGVASLAPQSTSAQSASRAKVAAPITQSAVAESVNLSTLKPLAPTPNYVIGRCVNMQGQPLAGVRIFMKGVTLAGGENTETFAKTKADGSYSMRVPAGLYAVYATYTVTFNDQDFELSLEALDGESDQQDSTEGVVEDFVWKIKGLRPDKKAKATSEDEWNYAYYGARVYPDARRSLGQYKNIEDETSLSQQYPPDSKIEITLQPQGLLIDGSTGTVITERLRMGDQGNWTFGIRNIPIGSYTATAKVITPDGAEVPVKCKVKDENKDLDKIEWTESASINFPATPTEFSQSVVLYLAKP